MYITIKNDVDPFLVYFEIFCRYETLWDGPVAMVAYSFGGLVLKSLVVEMRKHVYQNQMTPLDVKTKNCCDKILKNLKGVVFYSVPHSGGTKDFSKYFKWQCQQIIKDKTRSSASGTKDLSEYFKWQCQQVAKDKTPSSLLKHMKSFNREMKQLSIDFQKSICKDINIYAFTEGLPIDNKWVRFLSKHIHYPTRFHS
jgi:hypothetical protein